MPQVQESKPRTLCPVGVQLFVLAEVTTKLMPNFDKPGESERWIWRFVGEKQDEEGQFVEVAVFTGSSYGDPRAKLTWLLDLLMPHAPEAEKRQLNTDRLIGSHYEGMVKHAPGVKDPTQKFAVFAYLKPASSEGAPDPFAFDQDGAVEVCEECSAELSMAEVKACQKRWGDAMRLCTRHGREALLREKAMKETTEAAPSE